MTLNELSTTSASDRRRAAARLRLRITDLLHAALQESGMKKADVARVLGIDRSNITQVIEGNGNITVNTLADYLAVLGFEVDLLPVELGEIVASMREHRAPVVQEITQRDAYRRPSSVRQIPYGISSQSRREITHSGHHVSAQHFSFPNTESHITWSGQKGHS